jgi:hypothetical protein
MSQPRWSNEEFAAITASHRALINRWLNSPIGNSPPSNLERDEESISTSCAEVKCSFKEVQDLFNHLDLVDRALVSNYTPTRLSWLQANAELAASLGHPLVIKVSLRFRSPQQLVVFDVHAYLTPDLEILASRMLDPKMVAMLKKVYFSTPGTELEASLDVP